MLSGCIGNTNGPAQGLLWVSLKLNMGYDVFRLKSVKGGVCILILKRLCAYKIARRLVMHNHPSVALDSESTQMFSHLLALSGHRD